MELMAVSRGSEMAYLRFLYHNRTGFLLFDNRVFEKQQKTM